MHIHIHVHIYTSGVRPSAISILEKKLADRDGDILRLKAEMTELQHQLEATLAEKKKRNYVHLEGEAAKKVAKANTSAEKVKIAADAKLAKTKEVAARDIAKAKVHEAAAISAVKIAANAEATATVAKVTEEAAATVAIAEDRMQVAELELEKVEKDVKAFSRGELSQLSRKGMELMELMEENEFGEKMQTLQDEALVHNAEMAVITDQNRVLGAEMEKYKASKNGQASLKRSAQQALAAEKRKVQRRDDTIQGLQVRKCVLL
jgi:hypothetical protein